MNNSHFLEVLKVSFLKYLETHSRSNEKLKILHGAIAQDLFERLQSANDTKDCYSVNSLDLNGGKEINISGRYVDKSVDITINKNDIPIAGLAVKYVMSNYKQNSNNYFENMLGETANIRCGGTPYFQIFIIPEKMPYFNKEGNITKWEYIDEHNLKKYIKLSEDKVDTFLHTPNKTLVFIINISGDKPPQYSDKQGYKKYYETMPFSLALSKKEFVFGKAVVYNDYEDFIKKVAHLILSL